MPGTRASTPVRLVRGRSDLKSSSEVRFPVSSTSRIVHVGFVALPVMVEAESASIHGLNADCSPTSGPAPAAGPCPRGSI
jgi:hypothetical protein